MDGKLVAWAHAVKARQRRRKSPPPLWLFTDWLRTPDPAAAIRALPKGLAGVILRDVSGADAARIARICRARRLLLAVAGDAILAARLRAGLHLRNGRRAAGPPARFLTSSAHSPADCRRARQAGAAVIFLSPVFATASHPGAAPLGATRWAAISQGRAAALGGIDGRNIRALPRRCHVIGAVGALAETQTHKALPRPTGTAETGWSRSRYSRPPSAGRQCR